MASPELLNQCPQPTKANPDPPAFLYADPDDCRYYFSCAHGRPRPMACKPLWRTRFSEYYHTCVGVNTEYDTCTRSNAQRECANGFEGLIGHATDCHRYYNCSQELSSSDTMLLGEYEDECPHPLVFDIAEGKCKPLQEVRCGPHRAAPKHPCDYVKNSCPGSNCLSCHMTL
ncbi:hypothetical protein BsWGS_26272 [Bradybaena similaris]